MDTQLLESVKEFLRIDGNANDAIIEQHIMSASAYLTSTTGKIFDENNHLHRIVVKMIVRHWFDGHDMDISFGITSILTQIKYE